jgi:Zn-dependent peptidase ImmA (M78 family)
MKNFASEIALKYKTTDAFELAKKNGVIIVKEPLGNIHGYYNTVDKVRFIHINENLPDRYQNYIVAHLMYAHLTNADYMFLKRKQGMRFTDSEIKANAFALYFSCPKDELTVQDLFNVFDYSQSDIDNLLDRLYCTWDKDFTLTPDELLKHVVFHALS